MEFKNKTRKEAIRGFLRDSTCCFENVDLNLLCFHYLHLVDTTNSIDFHHVNIQFRSYAVIFECFSPVSLSQIDFSAYSSVHDSFAVPLSSSSDFFLLSKFDFHSIIWSTLDEFHVTHHFSRI